MISIRPLLLVPFMVLAVACHAGSAPPPPPPTETAAPVAATTSASTSPSSPVSEGEPLTLRERLAREAAARPPGAIPAEKVAAALSAGGVPVGPLKQVLARPIGARYCAMGRTPSGLVVSLCEFDDDAQAARGVALSHSTFDRLIPGRRLAHKHGTLLTLASGGPDPAREAEAARASSAFAAL